MLIIPEHWKSKRQIIIETYLRMGSVPETAEALYGNRDVSYVRSIIIQWKQYIRKDQSL